MAAYRWWQTEKKKERTVDRYFAQEIEAVTRENPRLSKDKRRAKVLQRKGFASIDDFYKFYKQTYGDYLHGILAQGANILPDDRGRHQDLTDARTMVEGLGLAVDFDRRPPLVPGPDRISKKI